MKLLEKPSASEGYLWQNTDSGSWVLWYEQRNLRSALKRNDQRVKEVDVVSDVPRTQPHTPYSVYTPATSVDLCHVRHPRHQSCPYTTGEVYKEHLPTTDIEVSNHRWWRKDTAWTFTSSGGAGNHLQEKLAVVENLNSLNFTRSLTEIIAQDAHDEVDQTVVTE